MIPMEVTLSNFLGYDDNGGEGYRFNFRDHRLWSISGDNGAGKSAIFDAITYTLFGKHRGGAQRDDELLRKGSNDLHCSFTFGHNGRMYRLTRTLTRRTKRTGAVAYDRACELDWYDTGADAWREVPGTNSVSALEDHVKTSLLGFDYDTFISSLLLLQGDSDKLIRSSPSNRFSYLSGILDLSRYRRLEERASQKARAFRDQHAVLADALREQGVPSEEEVKQADEKAAEDQRSYVAKVAAADKVSAHLGRVRRYHELLARRTELSSNVDAMVEAQRHAAEIRNDARAKGEIERVLPSLRDANASLKEAVLEEENASAATLAASAIDVEGLKARATNAAGRYADAAAATAALTNRLRALREESRQLQPERKLAERLTRADDAVTTINAKIAALEPQVADLPAAKLRKARIDSLSHGLILMQSYRDARLGVAELLAGGDEASLTASVQGAEDEYRHAGDALTALREAVAARQLTVGGLRSQLEAAERALAERTAAGAEGTCSRCGQKVSAQHIKVELKACNAEIARLQREKGEEEGLLGVDEKLVATAETALPRLRDVLQAARDRFKEYGRLRQVLADLDSDDVMAALPDDCRTALHGPVGNLESAVKGFRTEVRDRQAATQRYDELTAAEFDLRSQQGSLDEWATETREILVAITRERASIVTVRADELEADIEASEAQEPALKELENQAAEEKASAQTEVEQAASSKGELEEKARLLGASANGHRATAATLVSRIDARYLPPTDDKLAKLDVRLLALAEAEDRLALLQAAETDLVGIRGQLKETNEAIARVAEADRVATEDAERALGTANAEVHAADEARGATRDLASALAAKREERLKMQERADRLAEDHRIWSRLARLLGRGGIQLALMKRDLSEIEKLANPLLARISGGNLRLNIECLPGRGGGEEITFRCVDGGSADDALDVAFLSGGQKFRVAVALAAGIGQYAGLGGSMPSQIIDEGFGSLDEAGRNEMLDAIRDMAEHFERIIVVSHTESFHDPSLFPARYELRKDGRRIVVSASV